MSLRVRADGQMLCAAKHLALPDDIRYIDDGLHYALGVEQGVLVADDDEDVTGKWHWRRKGERFQHLNFERDGYTDDPVNDYGYDIVFWGEDWEWLRDRGGDGGRTRGRTSAGVNPATA